MVLHLLHTLFVHSLPSSFPYAGSAELRAKEELCGVVVWAEIVDAVEAGVSQGSMGVLLKTPAAYPNNRISIFGFAVMREEYQACMLLLLRL